MKTIAELQDDKEFRDIAIQKVGNTGYTSVMDSKTAESYFHPNKKIENLDVEVLKKAKPNAWQLIQRSIGDVCKENSGYYDYHEEDGSLRTKYAYYACVTQKTSDGVSLLVAATAYPEEYRSLKAIKESDLEEIFLHNIKNAHDIFYSLIERDTEKIKSLMEDFMKKEEHKDIFQKRDRDLLYEKSLSIFEKNKEESRVTHLYYHTLNDTVFLRIHNKGIYGDNPSRITFEESKKSSSWGTGIELGKTAFALRVVHPYIKDNEKVGYLEFGEEIDHFFPEIKKKLGLDVEISVIVRKEYIDREKWASVRQEKGLRDNYDDLSNYVVIDSTDDSGMILPDIDYHEEEIAAIPDGGKVFEEHAIADKIYIHGGFPLYDAGNNKVGAVLIAQDVTEFYEEEEEEEEESTTLMYVLIAASIVLAIFLLIRFDIVRLEASAIILLLGLALLVIIGLFIFNTYSTTEQLKDISLSEINKRLEAVSYSKAEHIKTYLDQSIERFKLVTSRNKLRTEINGYNQVKGSEHLESIQDIIIAAKEPIEEFERICVITPKGIVISSTDRSFIGKNVSEKEFFLKGLEATGIYLVEEDDIPKLFVSGPFILNEEVIGVGITVVKADYLRNLVSDDTALGSTGETYLIDDKNLMITPSKFKEGSITVDTANAAACWLHRNLSEEEIRLNHNEVKILKDYRNVSVVGTHEYIKEMDWCLLAEIDEKTALADISKANKEIWYFTTAAIIAVIITGVIFNLLLTKTLRKEVDTKTKEIQDINQNLEKEVDSRTKEVKQKSRELELLNKNLEKEIEKKTRQIQEKLAKEEKATEAMIYILERAKRTNNKLREKEDELSEKNEELQQQSEELQSTLDDLESARQDLKKEKESIEKKVVERTMELQKERDKVEDLLRLKTEFVNQLSHDLRTPITPLSVLLPIVRKSVKERENQKNLDVCIRNAKYLSDLVKNTLNLARLESGKIDMNYKKTDMKALMKNIIEENDVLFKENKIHVINRIRNSMTLKIDRLKIKEVINNILGNSVKFMPKGGKITIDSAVRKDHATISIEDTGIGMSEDIQKKIFTEFYKGDESRHDVSGFGLGLAICKKIMELHNGRILVQSSKGKGTKVLLEFPVKQ